MSKIAAVQMCSSSVICDNLYTAEKLIKDAVSNGAELIVLPEMFSIFGDDEFEKVRAGEEYGKGVIQNFCSFQAKENNIWIVAGSIPINCEDINKIKAASIIYNNLGNAVGRYDKIHLFDVKFSETESYNESNTVDPGDYLVVIDTPFGKIGLTVCYDIRFPALCNSLFLAGAEIIVVPAAFPLKTGEAHWELLTRSRAIDNFCYIIGACQGGDHSNGRTSYGNTLTVDPWGRVVDRLDGGTAGVAYIDIDLQYLRKVRSTIPIGNYIKQKPDLPRGYKVKSL